MTKNNYPFWIAVIIFTAVILVSLFLTLKQNDGLLIYALDDTYIHMAIAKNVVEHGVWGITRYEFASASSSPLWIGLLVIGYSIMGVNAYLPLLLNFIIGIVIIYVLFRFIREFIPRPIYQLLFIIAVVFITPVTALTFFGMEHNLHFLLTLIFIVFAARVLAREKSTKTTLWGLYFVAPFLVVIRYEGIFAVLMLGGLLFWKREYRKALLLFLVSAIPVTTFGIWSITQGGDFVPMSIILKANSPHFDSLRGILFFPYMAVRRLVEHSQALLVMIGVLIVMINSLARQGEVAKFRLTFGIIFTGTAIMHLMTAGMGWLYRYEAYLIGTGLFLIGLSLSDLRSESYRPGFKIGNQAKSILITLLAGIILAPFALRAGQSLIRIQQASRNIYEQQYQMARFIREYYQGQAVAVNDIGAVNYYADVRCLDLWGLGSKEVARARTNDTYDSRAIRDLTQKKDVKIAILYDSWFDSIVPEGFSLFWGNCGAWRIMNNKVCGSDIATIYSVDSLERDNLLRNLKSFSRTLPGKVRQYGEYLR